MYCIPIICQKTLDLSKNVLLPSKKQEFLKLVFYLDSGMMKFTKPPLSSQLRLQSWIHSCCRPQAANRKQSINLCLTLKETWERCHYLMNGTTPYQSAANRPQWSKIHHQNTDTTLSSWSELSFLSVFWCLEFGRLKGRIIKIKMTVKWYAHMHQVMLN